MHASFARSPPVRLALALLLLSGQAASALHALEHLDPSHGSPASHESRGHHASHASHGRSLEPAVSTPLPPKESTGSVKKEPSTSEHAEGVACTLCLLPSTGQASVHAPDAWRGPSPHVAVLPPDVAPARPSDRSRDHPPARGPPTLL